jgi:hypothetical protein
MSALGRVGVTNADIIFHRRVTGAYVPPCMIKVHSKSAPSPSGLALLQPAGHQSFLAGVGQHPPPANSIIIDVQLGVSERRGSRSDSFIRQRRSVNARQKNAS